MTLTIITTVCASVFLLLSALLLLDQPNGAFAVDSIHSNTLEFVLLDETRHRTLSSSASSATGIGQVASLGGAAVLRSDYDSDGGDHDDTEEAEEDDLEEEQEEAAESEYEEDSDSEDEAHDAANQQCGSTSNIPLTSDGSVTATLTLNADGETVTVEVIYNGLGWVGFGVNPTGEMIGGEAIIGLPDEPLSATNPGKYSLYAESQAGVVLMPDDQQTLMNASITQTDSQTILKYTKYLDEANEHEISATDANTFIFGVGGINTLTEHIKDGRIVLSFDCSQNGGESGTVTSSSAQSRSSETTRNLWVYHGIFMAVTWAILFPLAIGSSMLREFFGSHWFVMHRALNCVALICLIIGFTLAVCAEDDQHFVQSKHETIGLVIFILTFVQAMSGLLRPSLPHAAASASTTDKTTDDEKKPNEDLVSINSNPGEKVDVEGIPVETDSDSTAEHAKSSASHQGAKSTARVLWEYQHRILAAGLLGLAWYNCYEGIEELEEKYGEAYDKETIFWIITAVVSGSIVLVYTWRKVTASK